MTLAIHAKADDGIVIESGSIGTGNLSDYSGSATLTDGTLYVQNGNFLLNGATVGTGSTSIVGILTLGTLSTGVLTPQGTFNLSPTISDLPTMFDITNLTFTLGGAILYSPDATFTAESGAQAGLYNVAFDSAPEPPTALLLSGAGLACVAMRRRLVRAA
jgi:hypothetical protein